MLAAATSGTTGPAGGLSSGNIIAIAAGTIVVILGIVATIAAIIAIIAGVYKLRKWWKNRRNERSNSPGSLFPGLSYCFIAIVVLW